MLQAGLTGLQLLHCDRLIKEEALLLSDPPMYCAAVPDPMSMATDKLRWKAAIVGPELTPYEGGVFYLALNLPPDYPLKPPTVRFLTRIYHCNVSQSDGLVCLECLQDKWSPALTIRHVLTAIVSLLRQPTIVENLSLNEHSEDQRRKHSVSAGQCSSTGSMHLLDAYASAYSVEIAEIYRHDRPLHDQNARFAAPFELLQLLFIHTRLV
jgi:ubiquitin-conjugating enzyme E2 D/E